MTGCGADELASTYYAARLPVDLGGEQHPSRLIRARLPRGGKKEHAQARQRRQHLLPFMLPYVRPTYNHTWTWTWTWDRRAEKGRWVDIQRDLG